MSAVASARALLGRLVHFDFSVRWLFVIDGVARSGGFFSGGLALVPRCAVIGQYTDETCNNAAQFVTMNNKIDHAFFLQKLSTLKAFGKFFPNSLLDHARAGEIRSSAFGFGDLEIAQHREGRRHASAWSDASGSKR